MSRRVLSALALALLSACSGEYQALKAANPQAGDYASSLASEYLSFAESESEQGNRARAEHFAAKGRLALEGREAPLESPEHRGLSPAELEALLDARARVEAATNEDARHIAAQKAARARSLYDCWVVQAERGVRQGGHYPCEVELIPVLVTLEETLSLLPAREAGETP